MRISWIIAALVLACSNKEGAQPAAAQTPDAINSVSAKSSAMSSVSAKTQPSGKQVSLSKDLVQNYFVQTPYEAAFKKFENKDWRGAAAGFGQKHKVPKPIAVRAQLLHALALAFSGQDATAAPKLAKLATQVPLASDYIHYFAARSFYNLREYNKAIEQTKLVKSDSIRGPDAHLLHADIVRTKGDLGETIKLYRTYLATNPQLRLNEARFRLAQALEKQGNNTNKAIELYRLVYYEAPLSSWARLAKTQLQGLLPSIGAKFDKNDNNIIGKGEDGTQGSELIARGMAYFRAMRNPLSERDFKQARQFKHITDDERCIAAYHHASSIFKARNRRKSAPIFDEAIKICRKAGNKDLTVKSAYQAGRSYKYNGLYQKAIARYKVAETEDKTHTYRDDARMRRAEVHEKLKQMDKAKQLLSSMPKLYPDGDMRAEAMWRVGWMAYKKKKYKEAVSWWKKQIATKDRDENYWAEGQAQYWIGRVHAKWGKNKQAIEWYRKSIFKYPLSYYALLSFNRVLELDKDAFEQLKRDVKKAPTTKPHYKFAGMQRPTFNKPGFARAVEYMKLGIFSAAEAEFRALGMSPPPGRAEVVDKDKQADIWAMAYLYHQIGSYGASHWVTRWHVLDYKPHWPAGEWRKHWEIAYPNAFSTLMSKYAKQRGIPRAMLMAIMREESAFNPKLESYANAIGLTQMIYPTAKRFSKGTGVTVNKGNFRPQMQDPVKNVTVGSNFLAFLFSKWSRRIMLIPPSYNAGEGRIAQWLRLRGHLPADEFLEEIKVDQPRNYSKRVLNAFFAYSYLYENKIPRVRNTIPKSLY